MKKCIEIGTKLTLKHFCVYQIMHSNETSTFNPLATNNHQVCMFNEDQTSSNAHYDLMTWNCVMSLV